MDDNALIKQFLESASESAFEALVREHGGLVYAVALRKTADAHQAEDITQQVFTILAQKAASVAKHRSLAAWLHRVACYCAGKYVRDQVRRRKREEEIALMDNTNNASDWERLSPILDEELDRLPELDRHALLLRFFEKKGIREIGETLGISEEAAKKRVARALEKLRQLFNRRGIGIGTAGLAMAMQEHATAALPAQCSSEIVKAVLAASAGKGGAQLSWLGASLLTSSVGFKAATICVITGLLAVGITYSVRSGSRPSSLEAAISANASTTGDPASARWSPAWKGRKNSGKLSPSQLADNIAHLKRVLVQYNKNAHLRAYPSEEVVEAVHRLDFYPQVVFEVLAQTSRSADREVQHRALAAFGELAHTPAADEARKYLFPLLLSSDDQLECMALGPLMKLHFQPADLPVLTSILSTTTNRMFLRYLPETLSMTIEDNPSASAPYLKGIEALLDHTNGTVQVAAACALLRRDATPEERILKVLKSGLNLGNAHWQAAMQALMVIENSQKLGTNGMALCAPILAYAASRGEENIRKIAYQTAGILNPSLIEKDDRVAAAADKERKSNEISDKLNYSTYSFNDLIGILAAGDEASTAAAAVRLGEMGSASREAIPALLKSMEGKSGYNKDLILEQILKIDPSVKVHKVAALEFINALKETVNEVSKRPSSEKNNIIIRALEEIRFRNNHSAWMTVDEISRIIKMVENTDGEASQLLAQSLERRTPASVHKAMTQSD